MERIDPNAERKFILKEHQHRYQVAANVVFGKVLDCACGLGYGSQILLSSPAVSSYFGVDIDASTIEEASNRYGSSVAEFLSGSALQLPFEDGSFDAIVCLETMEHTEDPVAVLKEFSRVLRPGGILVSSIPTLEHENFCEEAFGANPYHLQRFDQATFQALLESAIGPTDMYLASLETFTVLNQVGGPPSSSISLDGDTLESFLGSLIAISGKERRPPALATPVAYHVGTCVENERDIIKVFREMERSYISRENELRVAFKRTEELVEDRDKAIAAYQGTERELREIVQFLEARCTALEEAFHSTEALVRARDEALRTTADLVDQREKEIRDCQRRVEELLCRIEELEKTS